MSCLAGLNCAIINGPKLCAKHRSRLLELVIAALTANVWLGRLLAVSAGMLCLTVLVLTFTDTGQCKRCFHGATINQYHKVAADRKASVSHCQ
jgi:hypothetical protein